MVPVKGVSSTADHSVPLSVAAKDLLGLRDISVVFTSSVGRRFVHKALPVPHHPSMPTLMVRETTGDTRHINTAPSPLGGQHCPRVFAGIPLAVPHWPWR